MEPGTQRGDRRIGGSSARTGADNPKNRKKIFGRGATGKLSFYTGSGDSLPVAVPKAPQIPPLLFTEYRSYIYLVGRHFGLVQSDHGEPSASRNAVSELQARLFRGNRSMAERRSAWTRMSPLSLTGFCRRARARTGVLCPPESSPLIGGRSRTPLKMGAGALAAPANSLRGSH